MDGYVPMVAGRAICNELCIWVLEGGVAGCGSADATRCPSPILLAVRTQWHGGACEFAALSTKLQVSLALPLCSHTGLLGGLQVLQAVLPAGSLVREEPRAGSWSAVGPRMW